MSSQKIAIIAGAGPAGLTAALELLDKTNIKPIIYESSRDIGGISKTINYKGNRIDIGGHRFFSKTDKIIDWWNQILPFEQIKNSNSLTIKYHNKSNIISPKAVGSYGSKNVMLVRTRKSRIYYKGKFFDYPLALNYQTINNLGLKHLTKASVSYGKSLMTPIKPEVTLEDFFINRFGNNLYQTFFREYTEKVWGVKCSQISAEWGAQRIKGLDIAKVIKHATKKLYSKKDNYKNIETSLIESFLYPKYGPGQLWELVAKKVINLGGQIHLNTSVIGWDGQKNKIRSIEVLHHLTGRKESKKADYFFSTVAVKDLVKGFTGVKVPHKVSDVAKNLEYRDFITAGILISKLNYKSKLIENNKLITDNWIYIQEPGLKVGRMQIFNNWSPDLVKNKGSVWLGLEYFANEGDDLWSRTDDELKQFAVSELEKLNFATKDNIVDSVVVRVKKAYPGYFGSYKDFGIVREYLDKYQNLFLIGRNGMHRYNNQDHSMLTAIVAVENIKKGIITKDNIWGINTEEEYNEVK